MGTTTLKVVLGALSLAVLASTAAGQNTAPSLPFKLKATGPGVYAATDGPQYRSGSKAGSIALLAKRKPRHGK